MYARREDIEGLFEPVVDRIICLVGEQVEQVTRERGQIKVSDQWIARGRAWAETYRRNWYWLVDSAILPTCTQG